jgi:hypothetical protein
MSAVSVICFFDAGWRFLLSAFLMQAGVFCYLPF